MAALAQILMAATNATARTPRRVANRLLPPFAILFTLCSSNMHHIHSETRGSGRERARARAFSGDEALTRKVDCGANRHISAPTSLAGVSRPFVLPAPFPQPCVDRTRQYAMNITRTLGLAGVSGRNWLGRGLGSALRHAAVSAVNPRWMPPAQRNTIQKRSCCE